MAITVGPYNLNPAMACPRCCFGEGEHTCGRTNPQPLVVKVLGMDVWTDPSLPPGTIELRDQHGGTLASIVNFKVEP